MILWLCACKSSTNQGCLWEWLVICGLTGQPWSYLVTIPVVGNVSSGFLWGFFCELNQWNDKVTKGCQSILVKVIYQARFLNTCCCRVRKYQGFRLLDQQFKNISLSLRRLSFSLFSSFCRINKSSLDRKNRKNLFNTTRGCVCRWCIKALYTYIFLKTVIEA